MGVQDKTETATPKRREDARKKGNVARSMELNSALVLVVSLLVLRIAGPYMLQSMVGILRDTFSSLHTRGVSPETIFSLMTVYGVKSLMICLPIMLAAGAIGFSANVLQVGLQASTTAMSPDLNRMDPLKGMSKLVSWRGAVELVKSLIKVTAVGYVVYAFMREQFPHLWTLCDMSVLDSSSVIAGLCWRMIARACAVMVVIAILDFIYQRYQYELGIRMTKQEVKDEYKLSEGDPEVKGRIRQRQRQMARQRMMRDVPRADVIVTNPTHYAVAIMYEPEKMSAPTVVAKGQRLVAERIKEIAEAHGVPIVENPPVAQMLYKMVEIGRPIPEELYQGNRRQAAIDHWATFTKMLHSFTLSNAAAPAQPFHARGRR
ncbi:MAG: flagellar biosynthesis protein FlhB [Armatimonadetes bacterium]|nr:flagellar biosynthesis protein FlhB [Armatimonadota bacterium]